MSRLSSTPVPFQRTTRVDLSRTQTSGRAGKVIPLDYVPILREDQWAGNVIINMKLGHMPRPLLNGVIFTLQAWFVPKVLHPQFSGVTDFEASYSGQRIKVLGAPDREPPPFFRTTSTPAQKTALLGSSFFKTLGLHVSSAASVNLDLLDAFTTIYNHRLSAYSSKLSRRPFFGEEGVTIEQAAALPRAFWPSYRNQRVVPDYEQALLTGNLELTMLSGDLPLTGAAPVTGITQNTNTQVTATGAQTTGSSTNTHIQIQMSPDTGSNTQIRFARKSGNPAGTALDINANLAAVRAELAGGEMTLSLAELDKARQTQAFAKFRQAYAGHDFDEFANSPMFVHALMQGITVPPDSFERPQLLAEKRIPISFLERSATDGPSLEQSSTRGTAEASMTVALPRQPYGGTIIITGELCPERVDERMGDPWLTMTEVSDLPNALRDTLNPEPVDVVPNWRVDAKHNQPDAGYGFEPMNDKWNRDFTRLGGDFYQNTPGQAWTEQRSALWLAEVVNPEYTENHFLVPEEMPHDVFSDFEASAFEITVRRQSAVIGLTQIGDVLLEDNNEYEDTINEAV